MKLLTALNREHGITVVCNLHHLDIAGLAEVASKPYPDASQFDPKSDYFDPASRKDEPRWVNVDVRALKKTRLVGIAELKKHKALAKMVTLRPGNRLSITPVTAAEWKHIGRMLS